MNERLAAIRLVALDVDGTFTDGTLYYDNNGGIMKGFDAHDGLGLELLKRAGIKRGFITGRRDNPTEARAKYLGVEFLHLGVGDKSAALREVLESLNIRKDECVYAGDDINDLPAFEEAGVCVAVANAVQEVKERADIILTCPGGRGAVRELADMILKAKGIDPATLWMSTKDRPPGVQ